MFFIFSERSAMVQWSMPASIPRSPEKRGALTALGSNAWISRRNLKKSERVSWMMDHDGSWRYGQYLDLVYSNSFCKHYFSWFPQQNTWDYDYD